MVKIANVSIQDQSKVTIKVEDFSNTARLHAFACHFLPSMGSSMFINLARMQSESGSKTVFPFAQWKNILMSNRELSDEFRYVFDRKYHNQGGERPLGNTLDRPKLLLKRHFVQNTSVDQEQLSGGSQYQQ